jgi:hypothetical protein
MTKQNNAIAVTAIISGVILIIALVYLFAFQSLVGGYSNTVDVTGYSTIKANPDLVSVYLSIESKNLTSAGATQENTEIYDKLVTDLIILGFERKEIVTESFNVYPDYSWVNGKQIDNGYRAYHSVKIELSINDSDKILDVIDAGVNAGAGVGSINFELSQESQNKYKAEAMKLAAEDARIKADAIAGGFNKKVGKLISTHVDDFGYYPWNLYSTSGDGREEDVAIAKQVIANIQPGEKEITASVSAVFKLR